VSVSGTNLPARSAFPPLAGGVINHVHIGGNLSAVFYLVLCSGQSFPLPFLLKVIFDPCLIRFSSLPRSSRVCVWWTKITRLLHLFWDFQVKSPSSIAAAILVVHHLIGHPSGIGRVHSRAASSACAHVGAPHPTNLAQEVISRSTLPLSARHGATDASTLLTTAPCRLPYTQQLQLLDPR